MNHGSVIHTTDVSSKLYNPISNFLYEKSSQVFWDLKSHAAAAKSLQSYLTLCDPKDCSPPGSSVHGIFQARVLEWGANLIDVSKFGRLLLHSN